MDCTALAAELREPTDLQLAALALATSLSTYKRSQIDATVLAAELYLEMKRAAI